MPRWIAYTQQNIPGSTSFDLSVHNSLREAEEWHRDFCRNVGTDDVSMALYPYTDENYDTAMDFADAGCPFDYPSKIIERGPRGGLQFVNA